MSNKLRNSALLTEQETKELRSLIEEFKLTQEKLCYLVGVKHQPTLSNLLKESVLKARFRGLLYYLRLSKKVKEL